MLYRIVQAPPGYSPTEKYMVAAYETTDPVSYTYTVTKSDGGKFVATLEEARQIIPAGANRLEFKPYAQFLEVWEMT